jgi:ribosomal protein S6
MVTEEAVLTASKTRYLLSALVRQGNVLEELKREVEALGGEILKAEDLGERKLAFPVNKQTTLNLVSIFFNMEPAQAHRLEKELRAGRLQERFLLSRWNADPDASSRRRQERPSTEAGA